MRQGAARSERLARGLWWVGHARLTCQIYRALVALTCAGCDRPILPGEPFIRHGIGDRGTRTFPFCARCERFTGPPL